MSLPASVRTSAIPHSAVAGRRPVPRPRGPRELLIVAAVLVLAAGWAASTLACFVDGRCSVLMAPVNPLAALGADPGNLVGLLVLALAAIPYAVVLGWLTAGHRVLVRATLALCCHGLVTGALGLGGAVMSPARLGLALAMASTIALVVVLAAGPAD